MADKTVTIEQYASPIRRPERQVATLKGLKLNKLHRRSTLKDTPNPLLPGDLLEDETGALRIFKFVGFEEACWLLPEPASLADPPVTGEGRAIAPGA